MVINHHVHVMVTELVFTTNTNREACSHGRALVCEREHDLNNHQWEACGSTPLGVPSQR
jgi:hypothetical protein